jgi:lysophospholipase L1-like esterase
VKVAAGATLGVSALGCLVVGEVLCRACARRAAPLRFEQDLAELEVLGRGQAGEHLVADPELFWRLAPSRTASAEAGFFRGRLSNRAGLREEREIPCPKPPGELRVLFLGDSCTFGSGLLPEESYVQQVERTLAERLGRPVECVNAGVPGWSLWQGVRAYERLWPALQPDLVAVCFGWNDGSRWDGLSDAEHARLAEERRPPGPLAARRLCGLLWRALAPEPALAGEGRRARVPPEEYADLLLRLERRARARGHGLLVLVWPVRENLERPARSSYQLVALSLAERLEGPALGVLDLVEHARALAQSHATEQLFLDRVHGTALLNRELAAPIAEWIAASRAPSPAGVERR